MSISTFERNATIAEMAVEMDRRGAVIERLEAENERLREALAVAEDALDGIAQHPGPHADEGAGIRAEDAREALKAIAALKGGSNG